MENDRVIAYCAVLLNDEPAYENIEGKWLSDGDFNVVHRVAVSDEVAEKVTPQRFSEGLKISPAKTEFSA